MFRRTAVTQTGDQAASDGSLQSVETDEQKLWEDRKTEAESGLVNVNCQFSPSLCAVGAVFHWISRHPSLVLHGIDYSGNGEHAWSVHGVCDCSGGA